MSWLEDMGRDAARIAFPDFELLPGQTVDIDGDWQEAWGYSTYTNDGAEFEFTVVIYGEMTQRGRKTVRSRTYSNSEAASFWVSLMQAGTEAGRAARH